MRNNRIAVVTVLLAALPTAAAAARAKLDKKAIIQTPAAATAARPDLPTRSYPGTALDAARAFAGSRHAAAEFQIAHETEIEGRSYVRLEQRIRGARVIGRDMVLSVGGNNAVESAHGGFADPVLAAGTWRLTTQDAIDKALLHRPMEAQAAPVTEPVWVEDGGGRLVPAWRVVVIEKGYRSQWTYYVEAETGEVLEAFESHRGAQEGLAFPSNPVKGALERVPLNRLPEAAPFLDGVHVTALSNLPAVTGKVKPDSFSPISSPDEAGNFPFTPDDPRFSEVQLYYNIDRAAEKFRALGFKGLAKPVIAVAHYMDFVKGKGFQGRNNAFFLSGAFGDRDGLFFYLTPTGGDMSWDADVIFHEYTHAVVNTLLGPDQSESMGALNEGTADYFAGSFMNDPNLAEYAAIIMGLRGSYLRAVDNSNRFPYNISGEVHRDGNMWSGALWDVRRSLGAAVTDRIVLATLASINSQAGFYDAAQAAVKAADRLYGGQASTVVDRLMRARGLLSEAAFAAASAPFVRSGGSGTGEIPGADPGYVLLAAKQFRFRISPNAKRFEVEVQGSGPLYALVQHRMPVLVYNDGTVNAAHYSGPGQVVRISVDSDSSPEIQNGTYYLDVANASTRPLQYAIKVTEFLDPDSPTVRQQQVRPGMVVSGVIPAGLSLGSRQYRLVVPPEISAMAVGLEGDTDVDLYIQKDRPVAFNSMGFPEADFVSDSARNTEAVLMTRLNTFPNLTPGVYWIAVANYDPQVPANFRLDIAVTTAPVPSTRLEALQPGEPGMITFPPSFGAGLISPSQLNVLVNPADRGLRINIASDIDAVVLVRRLQPVSVSAEGAAFDYAFRVRERGAYDITRNSATPLEPGMYYIAVANLSETGGSVAISYETY